MFPDYCKLKNLIKESWYLWQCVGLPSPSHICVRYIQPYLLSASALIIWVHNLSIHSCIFMVQISPGSMFSPSKSHVFYIVTDCCLGALEWTTKEIGHL